MTKFLPLTAIAALGLVACGGNNAAEDTKMADGVVVTVNGVTDSGKVYVALQNKSIFGAADATYGSAVDASKAMNGKVDVSISGVSAGDYAVAVFQDTNGNGKMDVASNGVPSEPWALSNGAGTKGAPAFDKAMMSFDGKGDRVSITLNK